MTSLLWQMLPNYRPEAATQALQWFRIEYLTVPGVSRNPPPLEIVEIRATTSESKAVSYTQVFI